MNALKKHSHLYRDELFNSAIPFWMNKSPDLEHGGYFTCLNRRGEVYDTDKFIWLQGREVWFFSMIYNRVDKKQEWLDMALLGADFMRKFGTDADGNWYFSLTREGRPLVQPYNIFSDCFASMAFGELFRATGNEEYKRIALRTLNNILLRKENPKGQYNKIYPGTRPLKNFSLPMILCNLMLILEDLNGKENTDTIIQPLIREVTEVFYDQGSGLILENVTTDGGFSDTFEGRLINPGHTNESMWFIMDLAIRNNNLALIDRATEILLRVTEFGWDKKFGGIFYFLDIKGHPLQQLEWDQKLWWVHIETLIAMAKAYRLTGNEKCREWFEIIHDYTWKHFRDPEYPEWYGYLDRRGDPLLMLKGGKWKGCFHIPRGLYEIWKILE